MKNNTKPTYRLPVLNNNGLTLVEILVVGFLFSLIMGGVLQASLSGQKAYAVNSAKVELQQDLRMAMDWMRYELSQAGPSSITDVQGDGVAKTKITFKIPDGVNGQVTDWQDYSIVYELDLVTPTNLTRTQQNTDKRVLAENINTITFTRPISTPNIIDVDMTAQKTAETGDVVDYALSFQISLRNN